jgi:prepilin-type processing-associated H-X9-DG protein
VNAGVWSALDSATLTGQLGPQSGFGSTHVRFGRKVSDILDGTANTAAFSEHVVPSGRSRVVDKLTEVRGGFAAVQTVAGLEALQQSCLNNAGAIDTRYTDTGQGDDWIFHQILDGTIYNHGLPPNRAMCVPTGRSRPRQAGSVGGTLWSLRPPSSRHPGGVNVLMADGTVRFVSENVDLKVWMGVATVSAQETFDNSAF